MDEEKALAILRDEKIQTKERWQEICEYLSYSGATMPYLADSRRAPQPWWAQREQARINNGVYKTSDALKRINQYMMPGAMVHISRDDKAMVAYTADTVGGQADKQVRIQLGRLIRKMVPVLTDEYITNLVAEHDAEVNFKVEFLTDPREIAKAYILGPDSCMAYSWQSWLNEENPAKGKGSYRVKDRDGVLRHPAEVYGNVPGLELAVCRDGFGRINGRALVRRDKKRYIRLYGDPRLGMWMQAEGYQSGTLAGLEFEAVPIAWDNHESEVWTGQDGGTYLFPYLDANGSSGSTNGSSVVYVDGKILVINDRQRTMLVRKNLSGYIKVATSAIGRLEIEPLPLDQIMFKDVVTDENIPFKSLDKAMSTVMVKGVKGDTILSQEQLAERGFVMAYADAYHNERWYMPKEDTFSAGDGWATQNYLDNAETRRQKGFVKLSAKYYENSDWHIPEKKEPIITLHDGERAYRKDTIIFLKKPEVGVGVEEVRYHVSELEDLKKKAIKVHSINRGTEIWADPKATIIKTLHGRRAVPGYHEIVDLWGIGWDFKKSSDYEVKLAGKSYWFRGDKPQELVIGSEFHIDRVLERLEEGLISWQLSGSDSSQRNCHWLSAMDALHDLHIRNVNIGYRNHAIAASEFPYSRMHERVASEHRGEAWEAYAKYLIRGAIMAQEDQRDSGGQRVVNAIFAWYDEKRMASLVQTAEAEAVEAPHYLKPPKIVSAEAILLDVLPVARSMKSMAEASNEAERITRDWSATIPVPILPSQSSVAIQTF